MSLEEPRECVCVFGKRGKYKLHRKMSNWFLIHLFVERNFFLYCLQPFQSSHSRERERERGRERREPIEVKKYSISSQIKNRSNFRKTDHKKTHKQEDVLDFKNSDCTTRSRVDHHDCHPIELLYLRLNGVYNISEWIGANKVIWKSRGRMAN